MLSRILQFLLNLFLRGRRNSGAAAGVNLADGIDAQDVMGLLEQLLSTNGGTLNLPAGTLPDNVTQEIESQYQSTGGLANLPAGKVRPEHLRAIKAHVQTAKPAGGAQSKFTGKK